MNIAIMGIRGIPANYGGFETFAEELAPRLVRRGHRVTVYCRRGNAPRRRSVYKGVRCVTLPTVRHKYLETVFHTFLSVLHVSLTSVDIVYLCNAINSVFAIIPRLAGKKVVINVDGLEWKRTKWNRLGKWMYRFSERVATWFSHAIISDSRAIQSYYMAKFGRRTTFISYGARRRNPEGSLALIEEFGLEHRGYILYVSRLEPENNALIMIRAYEKTRLDIPLVIVGDAPYGRPYIRRLHAAASNRVRFLGGVYGDRYFALQKHALVYLHGNEVGGTNPALLEAMASGCCIIANGVSFNRETLDKAGLCYRPGDITDLKRKLEGLVGDPDRMEAFRRKAVQRIRDHYRWGDIADRYHLFFTALGTACDRGAAARETRGKPGPEHRCGPYRRSRRRPTGAGRGFETR